MSNQAVPVWAPANEIGRNFTSLVFTYYDINNNAVTPGTLAGALSIARVDISLTVQSSEFLSSGKRAVHSISARTIPRNLRIR